MKQKFRKETPLNGRKRYNSTFQKPIFLIVCFKRRHKYLAMRNVNYLFKE